MLSQHSLLIVDLLQTDFRLTKVISDNLLFCPSFNKKNVANMIRHLRTLSQWQSLVLDKNTLECSREEDRWKFLIKTTKI